MVSNCPFKDTFHGLLLFYLISDVRAMRKRVNALSNMVLKNKSMRLLDDGDCCAQGTFT